MDTMAPIRPTVLRPRRIALPAGPAAAAEARRQVRTAICTWGIPVDPDVAILLTSELVTNAILHEASGTVTFHDDYRRVAAELAAHGVRPPCLITGVQYIPIAWYAGCASNPPATPGDAEAVIVQMIGQPPAYAKKWRVYRITSTRILKVNAFIRGR